MAELWRSGFEIGSATDGIEWEHVGAGTAETIDTTIFRSGLRSVRFNTSNSNAAIRKTVYSAAQADRLLYTRFYLYIATLPDVDIDIFIVGDGASGNARIMLKTDGVLRLRGSAAGNSGESSALSTGQWYRIEVLQDYTTTYLEARLEGTAFGSVTWGGAPRNVISVDFGLSGSAVTADIYMDDIVVNDDTGSFANTWPGAGEIIHLRPNAAGDNAGFTRGGTDSGANWSQEDEVTPNDATDYVLTTVLDTTDDYNCDATPAALASDDTIISVAVGSRNRAAALPSSAADIVLRIKASSGGTVEESAQLSETSTWHSFRILAPKTHLLVLYDLPGASTTAWTKTDLDAMQIGLRCSNGAAVNYWISAVWAAVHHKPAAAVTADRRRLLAR